MGIILPGRSKKWSRKKGHIRPLPDSPRPEPAPEPAKKEDPWLRIDNDPLADLALVQDQIHRRLTDFTPTPSADLHSLWQDAQLTIDAALDQKSDKHPASRVDLPAQFLVLITCRDKNTR
jgi:hypothetical protein